MIENSKFIIIILGIINLISLIFGIFGLMTYTKLSNEKFETNNTNYCIPCVNSPSSTDGATVSCETIHNYLLSPDGQKVFIDALKKIPNSETFDFDITGNATTATNSDGKGNIVYQDNDVGWCRGGTTTWVSGEGGHFEFQYVCPAPKYGGCKNDRQFKVCYPGAWFVPL